MSRFTMFVLIAVLSHGIGNAGENDGPANEAAFSHSTVPQERFERMRRGINTSHWFAQVYDSAGYTPTHFQRYITEKDIALIASLGFDHIRFSVEPEPMFDRENPAALPAEYLRQLDAAIEMILEHDLAVMFDFHPHPRFKRGLRDDDDYLAAVATFWETLARHLSKYDPGMFFIEPLNEPEIHDAVRWHQVQEELVQAVRRGAPEHTIIATCYKWSGLGDLLILEPVEDTNVVYSLHYYDPGMFTHQGATWAWHTWAEVSNVPYPSSPEAVAPLLKKIDHDAARTELARYGEERWGPERIDRDIAKVAAWARRHGVKLINNEFGVYRDFAPREARVRYLRDVREAFERHNIGWAMWDYAGKFGLVDEINGKRVPDPDVVAALGLKYER